MKELKIAIPTTVSEYKYAFNKLKLKVHGHRCKKCNARLKYSTQYHSGFLHGKRFMIDGHHLCETCLIDAVNEADYTEDTKCHWCGEASGTYKFEYGTFTIGSEWWNGFYGCKSCLLKGLETTPLVSGIIRHKKGKMRYI